MCHPNDMYYILSYTYICTLYIAFMNTYLPAIVIGMIAIHFPLTIVIKLCRACDSNAQYSFRFQQQVLNLYNYLKQERQSLDIYPTTALIVIITS
jgi:hypothetical protein